jgi:hypothetical protein
VANQESLITTASHLLKSFRLKVKSHWMPHRFDLCVILSKTPVPQMKVLNQILDTFPLFALSRPPHVALCQEGPANPLKTTAHIAVWCVRRFNCSSLHKACQTLSRLLHASTGRPAPHFQSTRNFVDRVRVHRFQTPAVRTSVAPFHDSTSASSRPAAVFPWPKGQLSLGSAAPVSISANIFDAPRP